MTVNDLIASATEDFLISISNKGLVGRAKREPPCTVALCGDVLHAEFSDGTKTDVVGDVKLFKCACPSRSVCKHVLAALLQAREQFKDMAPAPAETAEAAETIKVTPAAPKKTAAKKSADVTILPKIEALLDDIFKVGTARLPAVYSDKLEQFATLCHGAGFAELEKLLMTAAKECELYTEKSVSFRCENLISCLSSARLLSSALQDRDTKRIFKQRYDDTDNMTAWGAGAYPWYGKSGFCGITAVFYSAELKNFVTYTMSRPVSDIDEALKSLNRLKNIPGIWNLSENVNSVSQKGFRLKQVKMSGDGRLSSSESTYAQYIKPTIRAYEAKLFIDDYSKISGLFTDFSVGNVYAVLKINKLKSSGFDKVTQTYHCRIEDFQDNEITLSIKYSKITEAAILEMENLQSPYAVSVLMSLTSDSVEIQPFAVWDTFRDSIINIGFSEPKSKSLSDYAKFFK